MRRLKTTATAHYWALLPQFRPVSHPHCYLVHKQIPLQASGVISCMPNLALDLILAAQQPQIFSSFSKVTSYLPLHSNYRGNNLWATKLNTCEACNRSWKTWERHQLEALCQPCWNTITKEGSNILSCHISDLLPLACHLSRPPASVKNTLVTFSSPNPTGAAQVIPGYSFALRYFPGKVCRGSVLPAGYSPAGWGFCIPDGKCTCSLGRKNKMNHSKGKAWTAIIKSYQSVHLEAQKKQRMEKLDIERAFKVETEVTG